MADSSSKDIIFIDTETTGLNPYVHQVWEIAYAVNDSPVQSSFVLHSLSKADPEALKVNNYYHRINYGLHEVKYVSGFESRLIEALRGNTLCAANPAFDSAMLHSRWYEAPWHHRMIDIQAYAMPAMKLDTPPSMKEIAEFCRVEVHPDHTAGNDVRALQESFYHLRDYYAYVIQ